MTISKSMPNTEPDVVPVEVVAGIIWNANKNQILIARRPDHKHKGGYWEFPGGKVESGESAEKALTRELKEELNLVFGAILFYRRVAFAYPEKTVSIRFYHVFDLFSDVKANEDQELAWVSACALKHYLFPEANEAVVNALVNGDSPWL